ncbi:MAG: hypothetical protein GY854_19280 [Deltaproteobacteria bacterium]|nr:hypothetical protein [Deltaproteobacteria bacterium]
MKNKYKCPTYSVTEGAQTKRCRNFVEGGKCALVEGKHCSEWLKVNNRDLLGHPMPKPTTPTQTKRREAEETEKTREDSKSAKASMPAAPVVRNISDEEIASFKALGAEVCLETENIGEIWIVPKYTERSRKEISIEHAATLAAVCGAFPGAKVKAFDKQDSS